MRERGRKREREREGEIASIFYPQALLSTLKDRDLEGEIASIFYPEALLYVLGPNLTYSSLKHLTARVFKAHGSCHEPQTLFFVVSSLPLLATLVSSFVLHRVCVRVCVCVCVCVRGCLYNI